MRYNRDVRAALAHADAPVGARRLILPRDLEVPVLSTLVQIHFVFVPLIFLAAGLALICGIILLVMRRSLTDDTPLTETPSAAAVIKAFRALLYVTAGLGAVQALIGGLIYLTGARPGEPLHFVYGGIVLLAIPVAYAYSDQKRVRRDLIITVIAIVAVIGAAVRALMTGAPPAH